MPLEYLCIITPLQPTTEIFEILAENTQEFIKKSRAKKHRLSYLQLNSEKCINKTIDKSIMGKLWLKYEKKYLEVL